MGRCRDGRVSLSGYRLVVFSWSRGGTTLCSTDPTSSTSSLTSLGSTSVSHVEGVSTVKVLCKICSGPYSFFEMSVCLWIGLVFAFRMTRYDTRLTGSQIRGKEERDCRSVVIYPTTLFLNFMRYRKYTLSFTVFYLKNTTTFDDPSHVTQITVVVTTHNPLTIYSQVCSGLFRRS